jgi:hypothetical protein
MVTAQLTLDTGSKVKEVATVKRQMHQAKLTMASGRLISITEMAF